MLTIQRLTLATAGIFFLAAPLGLHSQTPSPSQTTATGACPTTEGPASDPTYPLRKLAFEAINAGNKPLARHLMRCAITFDPKDKIALRQEVYLDLDAGDGAGAIGDIDTLRGLGATDAQLEAQEGYIWAEKKNYPQAKAAFRRAIETGDSDIRLQAFQALRNLQPEEPARTLTFDLDSQYLNRFSDGVVDASAHFNQRIAGGPVRAYLNLHLLRDTASHAGQLPQIVDDNALMGGVGVVFQPKAAHYALSAEANEAYVSYAGGNHAAATVPDFRVFAGYYNLFRPAPGSHLSSRFSLTANGSGGFYSRYGHDVIFYLQPMQAYDAVKSGPVRVSPYVEENFAFDSNRSYYNNIAELIPGVQMTTERLRNLAFRVEYVRGFYLPTSDTTPNPYGSTYNDFRVRLTWSRLLPLQKGGE